jgi:hypothetical protein
MLEMEFLDSGGDEKWLTDGLKSVPIKLQKLSRINNILAHQPWKLSISEVEVKLNLTFLN